MMEKVGWGVGEERNVLFLREWTSGVPCYWELCEELEACGCAMCSLPSSIAWVVPGGE